MTIRQFPIVIGVFILILAGVALGQKRSIGTVGPTEQEGPIGRVGPTKPPRPSGATNRSIGAAATCDSNKRFEMWLFLQQPEQKKAASGKAAMVPVEKLKVDVAKLLKAYLKANQPEYQAHIDWSFQDQGFCEAKVQTEIQRLDAEYNKNMYNRCIWGSDLPVGRACVMHFFACDAARNKFDDMAFNMTVATQLHNGGAVTLLRAAGASAVADYIRAKCR